MIARRGNNRFLELTIGKEQQGLLKEKYSAAHTMRKREVIRRPGSKVRVYCAAIIYLTEICYIHRVFQIVAQFIGG